MLFNGLIFVVISVLLSTLFLQHRSSCGDGRLIGTALISQWSPTSISMNCQTNGFGPMGCVMNPHSVNRLSAQRPDTVKEPRGSLLYKRPLEVLSTLGLSLHITERGASHLRVKRAFHLPPYSMPSQQQNISMLANTGSFWASPNPLMWQRYQMEFSAVADRFWGAAVEATAAQSQSGRTTAWKLKPVHTAGDVVMGGFLTARLRGTEAGISASHRAGSLIAF